MLRAKIISSVGVGLVIVAGCVPSGVHTPSSFAGPIPLTVANNQAPGNDMCAILMLPPGSSKIENMLGKTKIAPGGHADFSVAAGTYRLGIANCQITGDQGNSQKGSYMSGVVGKIDALEISGPQYVSVGAPPSSPPSGYTVHTIATTIQRTAVCSPPGDQCDANTNCCSGAPCSAAGRCK